MRKAREYSYNCGRPVEKIVVPSLAQTINLFDKLRTTGKVFRVDFVKRTTGETRTMVCRFGVKKGLRGGKKAYDAGDKGLFTVWDFGKGYRSITIDNIIFVKTGGVVYYLNTDTPPGEYPADMVHEIDGRTIAAVNHPMQQRETAPAMPDFNNGNGYPHHQY